MEKMEEYALNSNETTTQNEEVIEEIMDVNTDNTNVESIAPSFEMPKVEEVRPVEATQTTKQSSNFDSLFDNLYSDVAGANNFIANLLEQKKTVGLNETYLEEEKQKLEKAKSDFEEYKASQNESIELEKKRIEEYEKAQKTRLENEQAAFSEEVTATRKDLELTAVTNKNELDKLIKEREEFDKYKAAEEEALKLANEKLQMEQSEFAKYKEIEENKIETAKNKNRLDREAFEKESANTRQRLDLANSELEEAKQQFEKYKDVEKEKLELESKNLSQSCARFKELVSQFNSGFKGIPNNQ